MFKKLSINPDSYRSVLLTGIGRGIYRYQQSRPYQVVRGVIASIWVVVVLIIEPVVLHIHPLESYQSFLVPLLSLAICAQIADYIFFKVSKSPAK